MHLKTADIAYFVWIHGMRLNELAFIQNDISRGCSKFYTEAKPFYSAHIQNAVIVNK